MKVEVAIAKISPRGQIVIPQEIREDAHIKPETKFLIFNEDNYILLKPIKKQIQDLKEEIEEIKDIREAGENFKKGEFVEIDGKKSAKEIMNILEKHKW